MRSFTVTVVEGTVENAKPEMAVMPLAGTLAAGTLAGFSRLAWISARVGVAASKKVHRVTQDSPSLFIVSS
jgi:hypothetical protein